MRTRRRALLLTVILLAALAACRDGDGDDGGARPAPSTTAAPTDDGPAEGEGDPRGSDDLDGRTFVVTAMTEEGGTVRRRVEGSVIRLRFETGEVTVTAGCNHITARYTVDDDSLTVVGGMSTQMGCDPNLMDQDAWLAEVLQGRVVHRLDGDDLTLTAGEVVLTLVDRERVSPDRPLRGTIWILEAISRGEGSSATTSSPPPGVDASVNFAEDGSYTVTTGCNAGHGTYTVEGDSLHLERPALTRKGCGPDAERVERAVMATFGATVDYEIDEATLTLTTAAGGLTYRGTPGK